MPRPSTNVNGTSPSAKPHQEYFFSEADVMFRVENMLFRVHKRFFIRESPYFQSLFAIPGIPCEDPPGTSKTNPVVLNDITSEGFESLLWVFYNPKYSIYDASVEKWQMILTLAQKWTFKEVEQLCIRELERLTISPVEKIHIYQTFKLDRRLLLKSYMELTTRSDPLDIEEGHKLGIETSLQIARAREFARGSDSPSKRSSSAQLRESELLLLVQRTFGLGETRTNGS
ncbi:hypothetical protein BGW80DRAFT_104515 [Lactifluus volemus]|nr:hypothetical protein BGW80DRAFT_104515 [Lactifluus volemus]